MLSKKTKYGIKALVYLAELSSAKPVGIQEIADQKQIPKKFLDAILLEVRKAGILLSRKGKGGGYSLARAPQDISLGAIIRVLDGPLALTPCASRTAFQPCDDCDDVNACRIRQVMIDVREAMATVLDDRSLADLAIHGHDFVPDFVI
jgi:Rrf2 family protein